MRRECAGFARWPLEVRHWSVYIFIRLTYFDGSWRHFAHRSCLTLPFFCWCALTRCIDLKFYWCYYKIVESWGTAVTVYRTSFCFHKLYDRINHIAHIKPFTQSNRHLLADITCFLYTICSFALGRSATLMTLLFRSLPPPMLFINRCTWRSSQHYILTTVVTSSMRVTFASITYVCLCFLEVIVLAPSSVCFSTTATYLPSCSFIYLYVLCYCYVFCVACGSLL